MTHFQNKFFTKFTLLMAENCWVFSIKNFMIRNRKCFNLNLSDISTLKSQFVKFMSLYRDIICNNGPFEGHLLDGHVTSRFLMHFPLLARHQ